MEIPREIWHEICSYLDVEDWQALQLTSRAISQITRDARPPIVIQRVSYGGRTRWGYYHSSGIFVCHRRDGPACIKAGMREWFIHDRLHREHGPAREWPSGGQSWYFRGLRHRADGPAVKFGDYEEWWVHGERHRENKPAIVSADRLEWWVRGKKHRRGGPAVIDFKKNIAENWINGVFISTESNLKK